MKVYLDKETIITGKDEKGIKLINILTKIAGPMVPKKVKTNLDALVK